MIELNIYNENLVLQGIIDTYSSLIWNRKFFTPSTIELQCPATENNIALLKKYSFVERADTCEVCYIRDVKIETDLEKGTVLTAVCDSLTAVLYNRVNLTEETTLRNLILKNCVSSSYSERNIAGISVSESLNIACSARKYANVGENVEAYARLNGWGLHSVFDHSNNKILIETIAGIDRSIAQSINPQAIFSAEFGNLLSSMYQASDIGAVTNLWISYRVPPSGGTPGYDSAALRGLTGAYSGLAKIEKSKGIEVAMTSEVTNMHNEDGSLIYRDVVDWAATAQKIEQEAASTLIEPTENFEGAVSAKSGYRTLWDLGDVVTVFNTAWGISVNQRIAEVCEVYDNTENSVTPVFGTPAITIWDKIKKG